MRDSYMNIIRQDVQNSLREAGFVEKTKRVPTVPDMLYLALDLAKIMTSASGRVIRSRRDCWDCSREILSGGDVVCSTKDLVSSAAGENWKFFVLEEQRENEELIDSFYRSGNSFIIQGRRNRISANTYVSWVSEVRPFVDCYHLKVDYNLWSMSPAEVAEGEAGLASVPIGPQPPDLVI